MRESVPHHPQLTPQDATAEVKGGRFIKCDVAGLFLAGNQMLDTVAESDFWHEAWLRDDQGDAEADAFHSRSAEERKRIKPIETCQHPPNQIRESPPPFDGYVNRQCAACGEWLPCRKQEQPA